MNPSTVLLDPDKVYEIVAGEPQEKEMGGARHGTISARLIGLLWPFVDSRGLGELCGPDTTFRIGENERLPDASFVAASRIPQTGVPEGIWPFAPDLAVEVISPNDLYVKVRAKIREYFAAGVRQVWLISPEDRNIILHRSLHELETLNENDVLVCEELFPGFQCPVSRLFPSSGR